MEQGLECPGVGSAAVRHFTGKIAFLAVEVVDGGDLEFAFSWRRKPASFLWY